MVVYAGTASKTLAPALRLAWLMVPSHLVDDVTAQHELTLGHAERDRPGRARGDARARSARAPSAADAPSLPPAPRRSGGRPRRGAARGARGRRRRRAAPGRLAPGRHDEPRSRARAASAAWRFTPSSRTAPPLLRCLRRCCSATPRSPSQALRRAAGAGDRRPLGRPTGSPTDTAGQLDAKRRRSALILQGSHVYTIQKQPLTRSNAAAAGPGSRLGTTTAII